MSIGNSLKKFGIEKAFDYIYKGPDVNILKIMD